jgi:hypothetical protein
MSPTRSIHRAQEGRNLMDNAQAKSQRSEFSTSVAPPPVKVTFVARATPPQSKDATPITWLCYMDPFCFSINEV